MIYSYGFKYVKHATQKFYTIAILLFHILQNYIQNKSWIFFKDLLQYKGSQLYTNCL
jgi:hypothetical protein